LEDKIKTQNEEEKNIDKIFIDRLKEITEDLNQFEAYFSQKEIKNEE
jgi:hypothetical protein